MANDKTLKRQHVSVEGECENPPDHTQQDTSVQDSGYTRPRVLILCPFRSSALNIVQHCLKFLGHNEGGKSSSIKNYDQLLSDYGLQVDPSSDDDKGKPADWKHIFDGNTDDNFKLGIQVNPASNSSKPANIRLNSDFYHSDLIVASPLGLRLAMEKVDSEERVLSEWDFLSSVEVIYVHQADVLMMQNWDHVEYVLKYCNKIPRENRGADFNRIRPYFLDDLAQSHRQIIISSYFHDPCMKALFRQFSHSAAGSVVVRKDWREGSIAQVVSRVGQVFNIVPTASFLTQDNDRFSYFCKTVLSPILLSKQSHTLIVAASYIDFVKIRNELMRREANAAYVSEYSRDSEISRGRSKFFQGRNDILLYSGRAHFFRLTHFIHTSNVYCIYFGLNLFIFYSIGVSKFVVRNTLYSMVFLSILSFIQK
jgi:U3 small nucleolar RNA-associated protein 25